MKVFVSIDAKDFIRNLRSLEKNYQKAINKEMGLTARDIESSYKKAVPLVLGRLRSSIHVESQATQGYSYTDKKGNTFDGTFSEKPKDFERFIGSNVVYAPKIEFIGGTDKGKGALSQAFDMHTRNLASRIKSILDRTLP